MFIITSKTQTIKTKTYDTTTSAFTSVSNHVSHEKNYVDLYYFAKLFNKTYDLFSPSIITISCIRLSLDSNTERTSFRVQSKNHIGYHDWPGARHKYYLALRCFGKHDRNEPIRRAFYFCNFQNFTCCGIYCYVLI